MGELDLVIEQRIAAGPAAIWRCLTEPELLGQWFVPRPWRVTATVLDPWPGGRFRVAMAGPDDAPEAETEAADDAGCVLLVEPERRLVWTDALGQGFRPRGTAFMTAEITLRPDGDGTLYRALVMHKDAADAKCHEAMGFFDG